MATSESSGEMKSTVSSELFNVAPAVQGSTPSLNEGASPDSAGAGVSSASSMICEPTLRSERGRDRPYP
eukprot:9572440-Lingulodinium_polyedra.AAC.1